MINDCYHQVSLMLQGVFHKRFLLFVMCSFFDENLLLGTLWNMIELDNFLISFSLDLFTGRKMIKVFSTQINTGLNWQD